MLIVTLGCGGWLRFTYLSPDDWEGGHMAEAPQDTSVTNPKSAFTKHYLTIMGAAKLIEENGTPLHEASATRLIASFWELVAECGLQFD